MNLDEILHDKLAFENLMTTIDEILRQREIPIQDRIFGAIDYICENFKIDISWNDILVEKVSEWCKQMYGERLKVNFDIGCSLVEIRGDLYKVRFPLVFGTCKINPFNLIENCTPRLLHSLSKDELASIANQIMQHYKIYANFRSLQTICISELKTAIDKILDRNPEYGLSRWASLQAAEKAIKEFIRSKGKKVERTHKLNNLIQVAKPLGLPDINETLVNQVQCTAAVRYPEEPSTIKQAYTAYCAALNICNQVAENIEEN